VTELIPGSDPKIFPITARKCVQYSDTFLYRILLQR
jgi:hypothetical protein